MNLFCLCKVAACAVMQVHVFACVPAELLQLPDLPADIVRLVACLCELLTVTAGAAGCDMLLGWWVPPPPLLRPPPPPPAPPHRPQLKEQPSDAADIKAESPAVKAEVVSDPARQEQPTGAIKTEETGGEEGMPGLDAHGSGGAEGAEANGAAEPAAGTGDENAQGMDEAAHVQGHGADGQDVDMEGAGHEGGEAGGDDAAAFTDDAYQQGEAEEGAEYDQPHGEEPMHDDDDDEQPPQQHEAAAGTREPLITGGLLGVLCSSLSGWVAHRCKRVQAADRCWVVGGWPRCHSLVQWLGILNTATLLCVKIRVRYSYTLQLQGQVLVVLDVLEGSHVIDVLQYNLTGVLGGPTNDHATRTERLRHQRLCVACHVSSAGHESVSGSSACKLAQYHRVKHADDGMVARAYL